MTTHSNNYFLRTGVLGDQVKVTKDKTKVTVTSESEMSKRCARGVLPAQHPVRKLVGVMQAWVCVCLYRMPWHCWPRPGLCMCCFWMLGAYVWLSGG